MNAPEWPKLPDCRHTLRPGLSGVVTITASVPECTSCAREREQAELAALRAQLAAAEARAADAERERDAARTERDASVAQLADASCCDCGERINGEPAERWFGWDRIAHARCVRAARERPAADDGACGPDTPRG